MIQGDDNVEQVPATVASSKTLAGPAAEEPVRRFGLSKSKLLSGLQCHKRLWLETHKRELLDVDAATQAVFDTGHQLGDLARQLLGPGALIEHVDDIVTAIAVTESMLAETGPRRTLFEPAFSYDGVVARADVLRPTRGGYSLIEVKASTSVKEYYIDDCAMQAWIIEQCGVRLTSIKLAHLNRDFVYPGDENYEGLLHVEDITRAVRKRISEIHPRVNVLRGILAQGEPQIATGDHCSTPFACPFSAYCRAGEPPSPEFPISLLPWGGKVVEALHAEGFRDLRDVPADRLEKPLHRRVHQATQSGEAILDPKAARILKRLGYPRAYLDFETIAFGVPRWSGTRPYQQIPFQWSCQVESRDRSIEELGFLDLSGDNPARAFAEALIEQLPRRGPVVVYNRGFEASRLRELAGMLPDLQHALTALERRLFDLLPIVRDHYYHPSMKGSWSLKAVTPTIDKSLDYTNLIDVANGIEAQQAYRNAIAPEFDLATKETLRSALHAYCATDTLAMLRLRERLCAIE